MPFRGPEAHLTDIQEYAVHVSELSQGVTLESYCADFKTRAALERCLQIISEAATRLGDDGPLLCPGIDWPDIRGLGNILRHVYHDVDDERLWHVVQHDVPVLLSAVTKALEAYA